MIDISVVMTGHSEGVFAGPALRSLMGAMSRARERGLIVDCVIVLDRADMTTRAMFQDLPTQGYRVVQFDCGDPALARNHGVTLAEGRFVTFLDADDLWSSNWLTAAHTFCKESTVPVVAHSEINLIFGDQRAAWAHADALAADFSLDYLKIGNYWDAMCFAERDILLRYPYRKNDVAAGYGHEDWQWNNVTTCAGIVHRPVSGTLHAKRRRANSQMALANERDVVPFSTSLDRYYLSKLLKIRNVDRFVYQHGL